MLPSSLLSYLGTENMLNMPNFNFSSRGQTESLALPRLEHLGTCAPSPVYSLSPAGSPCRAASQLPGIKGERLESQAPRSRTDFCSQLKPEGGSGLSVAWELFYF